MPLPYRTIFTFPSETQLVALAERQVQEWIEGKKKIDPDKRDGFLTGELFRPGTHSLGQQRSLQVVHSDVPESNSRRRLYRFIETTRYGTWQVDFAVIERPGARREAAAVLIVEARRTDAPDAEGQVAPPQLVKQLLAELDVVDGDTPVTAQARAINRGEADIVSRSIVDPHRTVSVIVAAAIDRDRKTLDSLRKVIDSLTVNAIGAASVFVMDYEAALEVNASLPDSHRIQPGRVRTYMPRVDLSDPADGRRHRILGPLTLARSIRSGHRVERHLAETFAIANRRVQLESPLPRELQRNWAALAGAVAESERDETVRKVLAERRETRPASPSAAPAQSLADRLRALVERVLGIAAPSVATQHLDALEERWAMNDAATGALQTHLERSEKSLADAKERFDSLYEDFEYRGLELADAEKRAGSLESEVRWLRRELASFESPAAFAIVDDQTWEVPSDLDELVLLLTPEVTDRPWLTERVEFVGDAKEASGAQMQDATGLDAQRVWDFVRMLHDYAVARSNGTAPGNVHACLKMESYDGFKVPIARHSPVETEKTLSQWSDERTFDVPSLGSVLMPAHCKSGKNVRMHYHDDTGPGGSGKVYIGYIGLHLTNSRTKNM